MVVLMTAFEIKKEEFAMVLPHTKIDAFLKKPFSVSDLIGVLVAFDKPK
jgi:hypothetical protein